MATGDFGLRPLRTLSGRKFTGGGMNRYPVANGYGTALFKGDPVMLSAGTIVRADPLVDAPLGVFMAASYIDESGSNQISERLPASASASAGSVVIDNVNGRTQAVAYVCDDPDMVWVVRADSSVSTADVGKYCALSIGTGNTASKLSGANLKTATLTTSAYSAQSADGKELMKIIGVYDVPGNSVGAANPLLECIFVAHQLAKG